jgi:hypothetical protein
MNELEQIAAIRLAQIASTNLVFTATKNKEGDRVCTCGSGIYWAECPAREGWCG